MTDSPESAFQAYVQAFEALDPEAAVPFYHLPCMFIAPQGVFVAPDIKTAQALLSQFMGQLRNQSYGRTEVLGLTARKLSKDLASCAGTFVRFNTKQRGDRTSWLHLHHAPFGLVEDSCCGRT